MKTIVAADNGVSGSWAIGRADGTVEYYPTPVKKCRNYTKVEAHLQRIDVDKLTAILCKLPKDTLVILERPLVNPGRFKATISAVRCLEATLIVLEQLKLNSITYIDSRQWQESMLPGVKGSDELKAASLTKGKELFPNLEIKKDADALLILVWARKTNL